MVVLSVAALFGAEPAYQEPAFSLLVLEACSEVPLPVCRVPNGVDAATARAKLGAGTDTMWVEGDVLHIVAKRASTFAAVCCSIQSAMEPVAGEDGLWALSARADRLDEAVIETMIFAGEAIGPPLSEVPQWRGPNAPSRAESKEVPLDWLIEREIDSKAMGERRGLTIYRPPGPGPLPVIYMADGEAVSQFAMMLQPLIEQGELPPLMIVGLHSAPVGMPDGVEANLMRHQEYLKGWGGGPQPRWTGHDQFLREEVMPLAESLGASAKRDERVVAGSSNGAAWALAMATDHPELFGKVIALSFGWVAGDLKSQMEQTRYGDVWLGAGVFEPDFHSVSAQAADILEGRAERVRFDSRASGHSPVMWNEQFPAAALWLFNPNGGQAAE